MIRQILLLFALLAPLGAAQAAWHEASSDHFVIYADDTPRDIEAFSRKLERFHSAVSMATGNKADKPSPSNRVTIYVVRNEREVQKLANAVGSFVAGFYRPRAGGSLAVVPSVDVAGKVSDGTMLHLLHEYVHHFTYETSRFPPPRWMSEGGAEFFSSASFEKNGSVLVGRPAVHRALELNYALEVDVEELLDPAIYEKKTAKRRTYDAYYGKAWLLYHYLTFVPERKGQLENYVRLLVAGKQQREAALTAFGDFKVLEAELGKYMRIRKMSAIVIRQEGITEGAVAVRALTAGEAAIMPLRIRSKVGVDTEEAKKVVAETRTVAARFPEDASVLAMLAEAEFDAGDSKAAVVAAEQAIKIDPSQVNAYVQLGYARFDLASQADDLDAAYRTAVSPFVTLNKRENDHPLPLVYFYRSYVDRGEKPTALAIRGLERAAEIAPFDMGLRMNLARQQIADGRYKAARSNLAPLAFNPHPDEGSEQAKILLETIVGKADGTTPPG
jgi:Flp pilus assembly protein TadD